MSLSVSFNLKYKVGICPHTQEEILQYYDPHDEDGDWVCCHCDTREQELADINQYEQGKTND